MWLLLHISVVMFPTAAAALWPHVAHFKTWLLTTVTAPWRRKGWNRLTRGFLFSGSQFRHLYQSHWLSYRYRHSESHWLPETHFKQAGRDAEGREEKENRSFKDSSNSGKFVCSLQKKNHRMKTRSWWVPEHFTIFKSLQSNTSLSKTEVNLILFQQRNHKSKMSSKCC